MNWKAYNTTVPTKIKGLSMLQFPVNSNIATTGHKLQGQTKQNLVIGSWNYRCRNWIYVVLSRVTTMKGLYFTEELDDDLSRYEINENLLKEEERLNNLSEKLEKDIGWKNIWDKLK